MTDETRFHRGMLCAIAERVRSFMKAWQDYVLACPSVTQKESR